MGHLAGLFETTGSVLGIEELGESMIRRLGECKPKGSPVKFNTIEIDIAASSPYRGEVDRCLDVCSFRVTSIGRAAVSQRYDTYLPARNELYLNCVITHIHVGFIPCNLIKSPVYSGDRFGATLKWAYHIQHWITAISDRFEDM